MAAFENVTGVGVAFLWNKTSYSAFVFVFYHAQITATCSGQLKRGSETSPGLFFYS